jgi:N-acetylglucosamine-6-sulfatase
MNENGKLVRYGSRADDYLTDVVARKSIDFIKRAAAEGQPFFIHLALYVPHSPATPAPRHAQLFPDAQLPRPPSFNEPDVSDKPSFIRNRPLLTERQIAQMQDLYRKRLQSLQAVDEMLASLIATLQATGQLEHTYIFFTSDNGFHMGEHRLNSGKQTAYEEDIRVLLIVRGPGVPAGRVLEHLTGNIDLAPTFAELGRAAIPDFVDGRSLVPLLSSTPPPTRLMAPGLSHRALDPTAPGELQDRGRVGAARPYGARAHAATVGDPAICCRSHERLSLC